MMTFLPPPYDDVPASTIVSTSFSTSAAALNITLAGLAQSVPIPSATTSDAYFTVTFTGSDVVAGDEIMVALGGDCTTGVVGGGPFTVATSRVYPHQFSLQASESVAAQICYSSRATADRSFKPLLWAGGGGNLNATFDLTPVAYSITLAPTMPRMQGRVTMTIRGSLVDGDMVKFVLQDPRITAGQECELGQPVAGLDTFTLVGLGPLLRTVDSYGAAMEIAVDTSLVSAAGLSVHVCYKPAAAAGDYTLVVGKFRESEASAWDVGSVFVVPDTAGSVPGTGQCTNATQF